jgi:hypothetical protein
MNTLKFLTMANIPFYSRYENQIKRIQSAVTSYQFIKNPNNNGESILSSDGGKDDGSGQQNAFRHALLNAALTSQLGSAVAVAASAQHEGMGNFTTIGDGRESVTQLVGESEANFRKRVDTNVDFQNNEVGREIGARAPKNSKVHDLTGVVANEFATKGLYMANYSKNANGRLTATISRQKITPQQYNNIMERLGQIENNKKQKSSSINDSDPTVKSAKSVDTKISNMLASGSNLNEIKNAGFNFTQIASAIENKLKADNASKRNGVQQVNQVKVG